MLLRLLLALIILVVLWITLYWTPKLINGTARFINTPVPINVYMDEKEIPGSTGFLTSRGFHHETYDRPILIVWIPRAQPGYAYSHGRMIFTFFRDGDRFSVGTPLNERPYEQQLLLNRYLLQAETSGLSIPTGDAFKSVYAHADLHFEVDRVHFTLKPNADIGPFPAHKMEIRVAPEVIAQMHIHDPGKSK